MRIILEVSLVPTDENKFRKMHLITDFEISQHENGLIKNKTEQNGY